MSDMGNKYLINYKKGNWQVEFVFPSYKAVNGDLGYYWDLGVSVGTHRGEALSVHIGLVLGWLKIVRYKKR